MTPMIVEHPLLQHKIDLLRNKQTGTKEFRDLVGETPCCAATRAAAGRGGDRNSITMAKKGAGRPQCWTGSGLPILRAGGSAVFWCWTVC